MSLILKEPTLQKYMVSSVETKNGVQTIFYQDVSALSRQNALDIANQSDNWNVEIHYTEDKSKVQKRDMPAIQVETAN